MAVTPEGLCQGQSQVQPARSRLRLEHLAQLLDGLLVLPPFAIEACQRDLVVANPVRFAAIALLVEPLERVAHVFVAWRQFESSLHVPDGLLQLTKVLVGHPQTGVGAKVLRVGVLEKPFENRDGFTGLALFQAGFTKNLVGADMLRIAQQDMPTDGNSLVKSLGIDQFASFAEVLLQSNPGHASSFGPSEHDAATPNRTIMPGFQPSVNVSSFCVVLAPDVSEVS